MICVLIFKKVNNNLIEKKNKETKGLTVERLRTFEGFEDLSESEAEDIIKSYNIFATVTYNYFQNQILNT